MKNNIERQTYSAREIAAYLGISVSGAYNLLLAEKFPSFRVGKRNMVTKAAFEEWLIKQQQVRA